MIQGQFDLGDCGLDRWERFHGYVARHPEITALLIAAMREDLSRYGRCSIQSAFERVRLGGHPVTHVYRASFARWIKAECKDLAPFIVTRRCGLDSRRS